MTNEEVKQWHDAVYALIQAWAPDSDTRMRVEPMLDRLTAAALDGVRVAELERARDDWKATAERLDAAGSKVARERDEARAEVERLKKQAHSDLNALSSVLSWSVMGPPGLPPPSRVAAAVVKMFGVNAQHWMAAQRPQAEPASPAHNFSADPEWIPSAHAEKVLVAVAKAEAQVGAEDMKSRALSVVSGLRARWKKYRDDPLANGETKWTERWDAAFSLSEDVETLIAELPVTGGEP